MMFHPFVALVVVSLGMGAAAGMPPGTLVKAFQDGVGATLRSIAVVVGLGTMLGKMMAESGAAARIATTLIARFGERRVHWAIMVVAFIVGIPVFFQVGFVLLVPLVFTIARRTGMSLVQLGIPLEAGLSVVHGLVPPHPAAILAVASYGADLGRTIFYALLVGLPTAALGGPIFARWIAVWNIDRLDAKDYIHPMQKPIELYSLPMQYHTVAGDICFDPFSGSGTQIVAAEQHGRLCYEWK